MSELTTTQETIIQAALAREDGSIHPLPSHIKGGPAKKIISSLQTKGIVGTDDKITMHALMALDPDWTSVRGQYLNRIDAEKEVKYFADKAGIASEEDEPLIDLTAGEPLTDITAGEPLTDLTTDEPITDLAADASLTSLAVNGSLTDFAADEPPTALEADEPLTDFAADEPNNNFEEDVAAAETFFNEGMEMATQPAYSEEPDPEFMAIARKHFSTITPENWPAIRNTIEEAYVLGFEQSKSKKAKAKPTHQTSTPTHQTSTSTRQPSTPRTNSKKAMVLEMLKRDEGASIAQITEVTGWQVHTIRAFLSISKKKMGLDITTNRMRVTGANQQGLPGSYSTYYLA